MVDSKPKRKMFQTRQEEVKSCEKYKKGFFKTAQLVQLSTDRYLRLLQERDLWNNFVLHHSPEMSVDFNLDNHSKTEFAFVFNCKDPAVPYCGFRIKGVMTLPQGFPTSRPQFRFTPPIAHADVDKHNGTICSGTTQHHPNMTIIEHMQIMQNYLYNPSWYPHASSILYAYSANPPKPGWQDVVKSHCKQIGLEEC